MMQEGAALVVSNHITHDRMHAQLSYTGRGPVQSLAGLPERPP